MKNYILNQHLNDDVVIYTTSLLLGLLGYFKYRNRLGKVLTEIDLI